MLADRLAGGFGRTHEPVQPGEGLPVAGDDRLTPGHEPVELAQLAGPEGGLHLGHPVVEAQGLLFVPPGTGGVGQTGRVAGDTVRTQHQQPLIQTLVIGGDRPALAGGDGLDRVEGEDGRVGIATVPDPAAADIFRADRVRRILDNADIAVRRHGLKGRHVGRQAGEMDRGDQAGPRRQRRPCRRRGQVQRVGVDIGEDGLEPDIGHGIGRCDEGVGRGDSLAGPHVQPRHTDVQGGGAIGDRDTVFGPDMSGQIGLEGSGGRALGQQGRAQDGQDGGLVPGIDGLAAVGDDGIRRRHAARPRGTGRRRSGP